VTVSRLCRAAHISRQGYYKGRRERRRRQVDQEALVELVKRERAVQPRLGGRKLRVVLGGELQRMGIEVGRDRFFGILRRAGLLLERRRRGARTTDSRHGLRTYANLYRQAQIDGVHQAWVSDLTYVRTDEGFLYISLISDAYSRKIVGHAGQRTLEATGSMRALRMALRQLPAGARPLHHSDRGIQYCCWDYVKKLESRRLGISMTEESHCYENGQAERLNGILKAEYGLGESFRTRAQASAALGQAVRLYNERRPHTALGYRTPQQVHGEGQARAAARLQLQSPYGLLALQPH
jgi:transposase InsO family protein